MPPFEPENIRTKLTKERRLPRMSALQDILISLRPGERLLLYILMAFLTVSAFALLIGLNRTISVTIPAKSGTLIEGVVGSPRFINPVLAISQADEDLTQLIYSGLTSALPEGGVAPELASDYEISEDGTEYRFTLRDDATFHDGTPVSAVDVVFTVQLAQDPDVKSPRRADWEGVTVSSPDPRTVVFKLQNAYAPFLENTTLGILPKHLWGTVRPEELPFHPLNTKPVGSGPYRIDDVDTDATGAATRYVLRPATKGLGSANIQRIHFHFYANQDALINALNRGTIDSVAALSPAAIEKVRRSDMNVLRVPLPRVFAIFLNQSKAPVLADASVREALDAAINKEELVQKVLKGYGIPLEGPIPAGLFNESPHALAARREAAALATSTDFAARARHILEDGGWKWVEGTGWTKRKQTLTFSLATGDAPELSGAAEMVADYWERAGIKVSMHVYPISELNANVIRPRAYDAILFGEVIGRTPDLFAFWHSSQRNDPGLNLSMYANAKADRLLASARATTNRKEREKLYRSFSAEIAEDRPAIFLFAPEFLYVAPKRLEGVELGVLTLPSDRFLNVRDWYTDTERVWTFFTNEAQQEI